jgi:hypothetical protein
MLISKNNFKNKKYYFNVLRKELLELFFIFLNYYF